MPRAPRLRKQEEPASEIGSTGLEFYGGAWGAQIREEFLPELTGHRAAKIYREMSLNDAMVGAVLFAIKMLIRQVNWRVASASKRPEDERAAEFLRSCMLDMEHTWSEFIDQALSMLVFGFALHEPVYRRRNGTQVASPELRSRFSDGLVGWRKLPIRAQTTISDWDIDADTGQLRGAWQSPPPRFDRRYLPIDRLLHFRTSAHKENPEGQSILRNAYRAWFFKKKIEEIEGIGVERDLVGVPIAGVPPDLLKPGATAAQLALLDTIKRMVTQIRFNERTGIVYPLAYDEGGRKLYEISLLAVGSRRVFDTGAIIDRWNRQIAMTAMADFLLLGHEKVGSFSLASSKTDLFATAIGAWLDAIAEVLNRSAVPALFALNPGLAGDDLPRFEHDDIETPDLAQLGQYVTALAGAGAPLFPDRELEAFLRRAAGMPSPPEPVDGGDEPGAADARAFFAYQLESGLVTINEARAREGLPPMDGGDVTLPEFRAAHPDWQWSGAGPIAASIAKAGLNGSRRDGA